MSDVRQLSTVGELLHWSYANLAMAHAAVSSNTAKYDRVHFMIRARLFAGLCSGRMTLGSLAEDERMKMNYPQACCYCGTNEQLSIDHLIPTKRGGADSADNLVWACRPCNSAKGATDVLEWYQKKQAFPPLLLIRRYLKLAIDLAQRAQAMNAAVDDSLDLPFALKGIPITYPEPSQLILWITK
jgi:hypothetical protein